MIACDCCGKPITSKKNLVIFKDSSKALAVKCCHKECFNREKTGTEYEISSKEEIFRSKAFFDIWLMAAKMFAIIFLIVVVYIILTRDIQAIWKFVGISSTIAGFFTAYKVAKSGFGKLDQIDKLPYN